MNVVYDSKAEAEYAAMLDLEHRNGDVVTWSRQPSFMLGDVRYRADFLVTYSKNGVPVFPVVIDVKGFETSAFRRTKKLWKRYGQLQLVVVNVGKGRSEVVVPNHMEKAVPTSTVKADGWTIDDD
jgi:hypothetical protein